MSRRVKWQPTPDELKYVAMAALAGFNVRFDQDMWAVDGLGLGRWMTPSRAAVQALACRGLITNADCYKVMDATEHYQQPPIVDWAEVMEEQEA